MKKLFLIDAMALIFRAYFAFAQNPRNNSTGHNTRADFGFALALLDLLQKERPHDRRAGGAELRRAQGG
jgi:DNA polymerase-1